MVGGRVKMISLFALILGFLLDLCFGDPQWIPHPIRFVGWLIQKTERILRKLFPKTMKGELWAGRMLVLIVLFITVSIPVLLLWLAHWISPWLRLAVETIMCYQLLAAKCLKTESMKVYHKLIKGDISGARYMLSMIVGRDTEQLQEDGIIRAAVETVAENTSDGVIAPLLFMMVGGAPLGFFYKAVNTMDSMVGYKNEKYLYFGRCAARLDDILNFIPARVSAWLMILSAYFNRMDARNAKRIYKRDRRNHESPNSAHTEAVCAGALRLQLAGDAWYFGVLHHKKTIGDALRPIETQDIARANQLMMGTAFLALLICSIIKGMILALVLLFF